MLPQIKNGFYTVFIYEDMNDTNHKGMPLEAFIKKSFYTLSPADALLNNWHVSLLCETLEQIWNGNIKRLIICMPPRHLKSVCISTAFPAWVIGMMPTKKVIVASYALPLAEKLSVDTKSLMETSWYKENFPNVSWSKSVKSKRKFMTQDGGFRLAASVNGSLTGEGGDILIADDPQKPLDILNKKYRERTHSWFLNTFLSRLNNKKKGVVILVMQRLHVDDLVGRLTQNTIDDLLMQKRCGWHILNLSAIATHTDAFRSNGEPLSTKTENLETLAKIKEQMGEMFFNAQYQQSPKADGKGSLKKEQLHFTNIDCKKLIKNGVFISIDTAFKCGISNDYTAISMWVESKNEVILFKTIQCKMEFKEILDCVRSLLKKYDVNNVLIEDKGSGTSIIQTLKQEFGAKIVPIQVRNSKEVRFHSIIYFFEKGMVKIHETVENSTIDNLLEFPHVKHDDMVDSISQFMNWYFMHAKREITTPSIRSF